jgi:uncharacterized protein (TIGR02453 family)
MPDATRASIEGGPPVVSRWRPTMARTKTAKKAATHGAPARTSAKKAPAKKAAKKTPATQAAVKKASAKQATAKKSPAKKATKKSPTKQAASASAKQAPTAAATTFPGFPADLFQFLAELGLNNEREWFEPRKQRYESSVLEPALAFIRAMAPRLSEVSPRFQAIDKRVGGSLMRVYRDVRFSKDKSPYKTNVGIQFRHTTGKDVHAPGLYVHLEPGGCFLAVGLWHPEPDALARIRARIVEEPDAWQRVRDDPGLRAVFELQGESLARPPRGFDPEHPHVEDLRRKDHIAVSSLSVGTAQRPAVVDEVTRRFVAGRDYLRFLCEAVGVAF